jgi:hypothetical protein
MLGNWLIFHSADHDRLAGGIGAGMVSVSLSHHPIPSPALHIQAVTLKNGRAIAGGDENKTAIGTGNPMDIPRLIIMKVLDRHPFSPAWRSRSTFNISWRIRNGGEWQNPIADHPIERVPLASGPTQGGDRPLQVFRGLAGAAFGSSHRGDVLFHEGAA